MTSLLLCIRLLNITTTLVGTTRPTLELILNREAYESLPRDLQVMIEVASRAINDDMLSGLRLRQCFVRPCYGTWSRASPSTKRRCSKVQVAGARSG